MGVFWSKTGMETQTQDQKSGSAAMAVDKAKGLLASDAVVVFSKTYCPYCTQVKQLFQNLGATSKVIELDVESDGSELQAALLQLTGQRTVPNVFIGGKHIGGCDATVAKHSSGQLEPLLKEAGAVKSAS